MDNYRKLLSVALELFASRGYDAVGIQEIVDAAHVTKPTLYHYFGSKQGLLETVLANKFEPFYQTIQQAAIYRGDLPLTLQTIVATYLRYAAEHRTFFRMQLSMWFAPMNSIPFRAIAPLNEQQQQLIEKLFQNASEDHGNMRGRHRAYAATLLGMIHTYIALILNGYAEITDELIHNAVHQFMHGIFS